MQAERIPQRKYALSKVAAGDYILPGNDGASLWRIARYTDGPSRGLEIPRDREFWGTWRFTESITPLTVLDPGDWSLWEQWDGPLDTRSEAIDAAMRHQR